MQRNSLSQVRTESRTAAHRVGNTTVWAEKQACTFSALSKHIFDTSNHKQNMLWAQKYQKSAFTQGLKVKSDVKNPTQQAEFWACDVWMCCNWKCLPPPTLICHINKRKPDSNCLIWRLYVEESRDNRLGSWRWQPAVLMWCGTSLSLSSIFDVPTAIRATDAFLGE